MRAVFVHGFTQSAASWRVVDSFFRDGPLDRVFLDVPDGLDFAATASALGDAGGPATYVGYSMGGRLCLQLALDRPDVVENLVLISSAPGIADDAERAARRESDEALAREIERDGIDAFLEGWLAQPMFSRLPRDAAGIEDRRTANTVERLTHQLRALGQGTQPSNWERLREISMPTLVFVGRSDPKYVAIAEQMATPMRANLRVLNGDHACHLEDFGNFAHLLTSWLGER